MGLMCARLSCGQHASASLQFDADGSRVLIIDLADSTEGIPVCRNHARTCTAPMGWTMHDERTVDQPSLWTREPELVGAGSARQVPMIQRSVSTIAPTRQGPTDRPALRRPDEAEVTEPSTGHEHRDPHFEWRRAEDLGGPPAPHTNPTSPLLSRAFRSIN